MSHNYPSIMLSYWERVSAIVYGYLKRDNAEVNARKWKAHTSNTTGVLGEKVLTANIKVRKMLCCSEAKMSYIVTFKIFKKIDTHSEEALITLPPGSG